MNIDTGLAVVIIAVLVFYLRLIILQRERIKKVRKSPPATGKKSKKNQGKAQVAAPRYSILSQNPRDLIIAGVGAILIVIGVLLYMKVIPIDSWQVYWWIPTAMGIVAFSWGFKL
jgi:hypothetical protein